MQDPVVAGTATDAPAAAGVVPFASGTTAGGWVVVQPAISRMTAVRKSTVPVTLRETMEIT